MDRALYKDLKTSRGFNYHYYFSKAQGRTTTLLFCHGFPSTSWDWRYLATYFQKQGYGIVVPDLLGYGGTSKPTDPAAYQHSLISKDLIDILDAEGIEQAIPVGHDWGSVVVSRLCNYFPERFIAYAFIAVPHNPPWPTLTMETLLAGTKAQFGYELYGYWLFFSEDGAEKILEDNWDSFISLMYPYEHTIWEHNVCPTGAIKSALLSGFKKPLPSYLTEADKKRITDTLLGGGLEGPLCWYKVMTRGIQAKDDERAPLAQYFPPKSSPIFFGAAAKDGIALPALGKYVFMSEPYKDHNVTIRDFDGDHWIIFSHADEINKELELWLENVVAPLRKAQL